MEVYIDDMLVKSRQIDQHLADLAETFDTLRKYHVKLNIAKSAFGCSQNVYEDWHLWPQRRSYRNAHQPRRDELEYALRFDFKASNNEVEYETLIAGIRMALDAGAKSLITYSDSQLVIDQVELEQHKFLLVAIDYFSKWLEVEPLARITENNETKFLWNNIVCTYNLPHIIIFDIGCQFRGWKIQGWCVEQGIQQQFTFVTYSQANEQAKVTNRILVQGIKTKLTQAGGQLVDA
ncbi:hypothetical protein Sango_1885300 [Sesamum angolense]|uniref:Integrase catalytic domain-containing protein n=1 Tax=Sesamum angolense TaxID=2727404 RepID=A0AAE2BQV2_9LAMI|nr:hypothetical protein Sango_1885300 [Sesamum angolense]